MNTIAACVAIAAAGCLVNYLLLCWYPRSTDPTIELHTVWEVRGMVYEWRGSQYAVAVATEQFTAATRTEAVRQYFELTRARGRWVRRILEAMPVDVVTVYRPKNPAA